MSPIPTLLTGIPSILKGAYLLGHEPKRGDFTNTYLEESLQNVISNNQADIVNKTLLNQATSGAKSIGARMQQQSQHGLDVARESGLLSEGQHAQALLQSGAEIQSKVGEQYQQLLGENVKYTAGLQDKVDQARLQLGAAKDEARRQYLAAHNQWEAELWGTGMDLATVGVNAVTKGLADKKNKDAIDKIVNGIKGGNIKDWDSSDWGQAATMFQLYAYGLDLGKLRDSGAVPATGEEAPAGDKEVSTNAPAATPGAEMATPPTDALPAPTVPEAAQPASYFGGQFGFKLDTPYEVGAGKVIQPGAITGVLQVGTAPLQVNIGKDTVVPVTIKPEGIKSVKVVQIGNKYYHEFTLTPGATHITGYDPQTEEEKTIANSDSATTGRVTLPMVGPMINPNRWNWPGRPAAPTAETPGAQTTPISTPKPEGIDWESINKSVLPALTYGPNKEPINLKEKSGKVKGGTDITRSAKTGALIVDNQTVYHNGQIVRVNIGDQVDIKDGVLYINGKELK